MVASRTCILWGLLATPQALDVQEKSVEGTAVEDDGLSQKQLAVLRYFAHLTFMTEDDEDPWKPWEVNGTLPDGGGGEAGNAPFGDLRYQLSHVAYSAGLVAQRTPAYTEVFNNILASSSRRMLLPLVWAYTPLIYSKSKTNGGSDPIGYKNIMYSGHVGQVMALHQTISGDMTFSDKEFDFVYEESKTSYNISGVMQGMYKQMYPPGGSPPEWGPRYDQGGVPCEPVMIFLLCNNFPHNAFHMHDGIHGTHFMDADKRWQDTIKAHAINNVEVNVSETKGDYFKIGQLVATHSWIADTPVEGGDSWALMWIRGWWNETDPADKEVIYNGYEHLAKHTGWKTDESTGGEYHTGLPGTFDFITTSFFPMIERQFWQPDSALEQRSDKVLAYMEQFGELIDTDGDGTKDSYRYAKEMDYYRDAATANLLAGMVFPNDGSSNDVVRDLFQANPPFFEQHAKEPRISHAEYPAVMVPLARYDASAQVLNFQLVAGDKAMQEGVVELENCQGLSAITLNGEAFSDYEVDSGKVQLKIPTPTNTPQVWQVTFSSSLAVQV